MLYLFDNQIVISIIINIYYPELRLILLFAILIFSVIFLNIDNLIPSLTIAEYQIYFWFLFITQTFLFTFEFAKAVYCRLIN